MKRLAIVPRPTGRSHYCVVRRYIRLTHTVFLLLARYAVRAVRLSFILHVQCLLSYKTLIFLFAAVLFEHPVLYKSFAKNSEIFVELQNINLISNILFCAFCNQVEFFLLSAEV